MKMGKKIIADAYALSPTQSGLLFQTLYTPSSDAYFLQSVLKLEGELEIEVFKLAWQIITDHHSILRTGIIWEKLEEPLQYVLESLVASFTYHDWQNIEEKQQQIMLEELIKEDLKKGFDLRKAPLFRLALIKSNKNIYYLVQSQHHIITDAWSGSIILLDLLKAYQDIKQGREPKLKNRRPYKDYIVWLQQQNALEVEIFWKNYLLNIEGPTQLSFKRLIEEKQEKDYDTYSTQFSILETEQIKNFARENDITLNTLILGAVGLVLRTYTQQPEVIMGVTVSGRNIDLLGIEDMVGLFINTLPLRMGADSQENICSFLSKLQELVQKLNEHAHVSLAQIQSWAGFNQSLFDVMFLFKNYPLGEGVSTIESDINISNVKWNEKTEYPLTIAAGPGKQLYLSFSYQTEHFNEKLIKKLSSHIRQILQSICKQRNNYSEIKSIASLILLTEEEQNQLIRDWNDTRIDHPDDKTIVELFEKQVIKTPNNSAVVFEEILFTYQELNEKANQLAHYLRSLGVGADTLVAIAFQRSAEMIIGLLGILKAGGAYVPLDPDYPEARLQNMLDDTNVPIIITESHLVDKLPVTFAQILCLDEEWDHISTLSRSNLPLITSSHHLAYIIYTSGSTGRPKGVMISHHSLTNLCLSLNSISEKMTKGLILNTSINFDPSLWNIFWPLISGSPLIIPSGNQTTDAKSYIKLIKNYGIEIFHAGPSLLSTFLQESDFNSCQTLKHIIGGGEGWPLEILDKLRRTLPNCILDNVYGPTETTIHVTHMSFLNQQYNYNILPIGHPISNTQIYILDGAMIPLPVGIAGEIYIGGAGLARGYLNRSDLTAEKFVPNPFRQAYGIDGLDGLRLYKTGDLARYCFDGKIEFLGRVDEQVKIRGFRIELGEIESTLKVQTNVAEAVVIAREDEPGEKCLVAYLVLTENITASLEAALVLTSSTKESFSVLMGEKVAALSEGLRNQLIRSLPEYMVPSFFVYLDRVPLTSNGKIDRKSLPAPDLSKRQIIDEYVAPATEIELKLVDIFREVLRIEHIGIQDNFFKLGGHSLLATLVISRIRHVYNIDIPLRAIFDYPTITTLQQEIEKMSSGNGSIHSVIPPITAKARPDIIPLSFAQARLWFLNELLPDINLYNIPLALKLNGTLDKVALEKSFNALIRRHESLRTLFPSKDGKAHQVIISHLAIDLHQNLIDLSHLMPGEQAEMLAQIRNDEANTIFDLSSGPLIRVKLLILSKEEQVLLVTMHHIISDGWSMGIFFKELSYFYDCYLKEVEPKPLPPLLIQYADFALWQREWLQGRVLETELSYWRGRLANIPEVLEIITDKERPKKLSYKGAEYRYSLSKKMKDDLNYLSKLQSTSLFMTLLAIFQVLLYRYTGQKDIVVGTAIANRNYQEIEGLIGFFINTLALRTIFEGNETFINILQKVKETTLQDYQHQDVPFEQLVDHLNVTRELNRNPVFQVMFMLQNGVVAESPLSLQNIWITVLPSDYVARFDLSVSAYEHSEGIDLSFGYATDLYVEESIKRMACHFEALIKAVTEDTLKPINSLSFLTGEEQKQLLIEWNDTKTNYPEEKTVVQLFEEQVTKTPNDRAVIFEDEALSYQELNKKANQLAYYLSCKGVGTDSIVAIAVERSLEMVIGCLGTWKTGGAYVPLDPDYPEARLQFMLEDTKAAVLITESHSLDKLKTTLSFYKGTIIIIDRIENQLLQQNTDNPNHISFSHHLAYVIYTSGSTGKPKGVMVAHQSLNNFLISMKEKMALLPSDRFLAITTLAFDIAGLELYLPLLSGAILLLAKKGRTSNPEDLKKLLEYNDVTVMQATPSTWQMLLDNGWLGKKNLKVLCGGEAIQRSLMNSLISTVKNVWNLYGPTETTIWSSAKYYNPSTGNIKKIFIGTPLANTEIYILDAYMNPVPVGVAGEIYIGGVGLARGYLNRTDLTAEKFVPNLFSSREGLRLYRTGDLARYYIDGNIEFLGRIDDQIKLRGFRIELGEIESVLNAQIDVAQAVVIATEDEPGLKQLVAYIVLKEKGGDIALLTENLRSNLSHCLPEYMVPSYFVFIDDVPLTQNGKIDRKSLPAPNLYSRQIMEEYCTPSTKMELELAAIFREVLRIERIGIHDNFFKLGGHSLLATQLISRIRHIYNIDLPLRSIFEHPTINTLQDAVEKLVVANACSLAPPLIVKKRPEFIPLSFAQSRLWFLSELLPEVALYNILLTRRLKGSLNRKALEKGLNALIKRHESLRTVFPSVDGKAYQSVLPHLGFDLNQNLIDLSSIEQERSRLLESVALKETNTGFDLASGPLIRLKLVILSKEEHVLLVTMHHIISDGWSMEIIFRELAYFYNSYERGEEPKLLPLPIQYADFALWQREWLQGEVLETELSYWKKALSNIPETLEIKTDKPRPEERSYQGAQYYHTLSQEIKNDLNHLSKIQGTSLFMTLLAIFQVLLYRYTGQKDIVVGSPTSSRHYQEIETLIGFFINTIALRTLFDEKESFLSVLQKVKETTLQGYQHQDVHFDQLVDYLNVPRVLNKNPIFQVEFSFDSESPHEEVVLNNLSIEPFPIEYAFSRFDLRLLASEFQGGISLHFEYATELFEEESIKRFACHFEELAKTIINDPDRSIDKLCFLTAREKQQILIEWNDTKTEYPENKTIIQLFEEQVVRTPNNIAVLYGEEELTYQELNEKANQLARYLRNLGVGVDTVVAIAIQHSLEMIIGLLGILKAGGAYVPLDPDYPEARLQYILEDTNVPVILTDSQTIDKIPATFAQIICVDEEWDNISTLSTYNVAAINASHHLAYVIYTSGSTGIPKGILISHRNLSHYLRYAKDHYLISEQSITLLHSSITFDMSITSLYLPLITGNRLQVLTIEAQSNILEAIANNINKVNFIKLTPTHLKALKNQGSFARNGVQFGDKKSCFVIGGENLLKEDIACLFKDVPSNISIFNEYGPTETTVGCCTFKVEHLETLNQDSISIGRPIPNTQVYLLDGVMNPVPVGIVGEIYIGGAGLARGYLNRTDLTAEKFVPNPFVTIHEPCYFDRLRLYRTGDLARYCIDGNIEFLGRIDEQVKLRGYRIELTEIESILNAQREVAQAVVILREDKTDEKHIVAYVVPEETVTSSLEKIHQLSSSAKELFSVLNGEKIIALTEALRSKLYRSLPEYMIPSFFVYIDKLPLTQNGKLDRKSLPAPDLSLRQIIDEYVAPSNEVEQKLADIWNEVLRIDRIGIQDNFFQVGGHSLLATQLISRIRQHYNIDIPLRAIFDHPTIHALQQEIVKLTKENSVSLIPPLSAKKRPDFIPLSFAQVRLWFLNELLPEVALYHIPLVLRLSGDLNKEALEKAFNALIRRHENLRTVFLSEDGSARQLVRPQLVIDLNQNLIDLSAIGPGEQSGLVESIAVEEANTRFNLLLGPLIRIKLILLSKKEYRLLVTMPHIVSDGWSTAIFFKELSYFYNCYLKRVGPDLLSPLPIQYADFALWQREWLQGEALDAELSYWKKQLSNIPEILEIRTDKERPKNLSYRGAQYNFCLSQEIRVGLNELSKLHGASLFMTLLAVFQVLLYRYTGQKDIVVGSPMANRSHREIEDLIGFFVNTIALRTILQGSDSFLNILHKVKETTLEAYQHQNVPFEQLVDHLNITRELNRNPVFQVMFILENGVSEENFFALQDIQATLVPPYATVAKFDLSVSAYEHQEGINIGFNYSTELFEEESIKRLARHFETLIKEIIKDASQPINSLVFLTPDEQKQLLIDWNNTKSEYTENKSIIDLFEQQVAKTPQNVAVVFDETQLSYLELNQKANQLAHYLRSLEVGADTLVAIAVDRTLEMVIGLLGVLKAGGAYVPLDPEYPEARLQYMLEDTKAAVLITQSHLQEKLEKILFSYTGLTVVVDQIKQLKDCSLQPQGHHNPNPITLPHHLAYVIYTSGSTGKPKGVMVQHAGVVNCIHAIKQLTQTTSNEIFLALTSISFDVAALDYYLPLSIGAKIILTSKTVQKDGFSIFSLIKKFSVTSIQGTPSLIAMLMETKKDFGHPTKLMLAGEALNSALCENLCQTNDVFNIYGPTEGTIYSLLSNIKNTKKITIGRPIPNTKAYLLDESMNPVPVGVTGEIYIGGTGLARGYLNRTDLTAEKFIPNPFVNAQDPHYFDQLRLYRTGDLARYLPDGNIEFLGRRDDQVKIRGFRIELGEIETALNAQIYVKQSVVIAREDEPGQKHIVAYILPEEDLVSSLEKITVLSSSDKEIFSVLKGDHISSLIENLRTDLNRSLPEYMIPSFFVFIDRMPLTANGKIDKKSLPVPDLTLQQMNEEHCAPTTEIERGLAAVFCEVLRIDRIGIYDNFFKLGGHSLLATQLISRIRLIYNIDIALRAVFEHPTIYALQQEIEKLTKTKVLSVVPPIIAKRRPDSIPLSFAQARLWFLTELLPGVALYNIPFTVRLIGSLNTTALEQAFNTLIARHESLRTIFLSENGQARQLVTPHLAINLSQNLIDLSRVLQEEKEERLKHIVNKEVNTNFSLSMGPLIRVKLVLLSQEEHVLLVTMHHIVSDGWSLGLFFKELSIFYNSYERGLEPKITPLPIQYADFALWQREWLQGEVLEAQLSYWKKQLSNIPDLLEIKTDKERPKELSYKGAQYQYILSKKMKDALQDLSKEQGASLFMTLLAIFQILLYRYTGQKDIVVGSPIANRHYQEIEGLIGFFVNTLALRTTMEAHESFLDVLRKVKETTLQGYQHQDVYFDQLVDYLQVPRILNRNPVFQVEFSFESASRDKEIFLNDLSIIPDHIDYTFSKIDLRVLASELQEGLCLNFDYATDLFEPDSIKSFAYHFEALTTEIIKDVSKSIGNYSILTVKEQKELLREWNDTQRDYPKDKTIIELFEEQVTKIPHNKAVIFEETHITYQELNEKTNQLAHYLRGIGVGADTLVAIAVHRSIEMVIGMLGILKAGGAYVPLDPEYPEARLQYILDDTQVPIIITDSRMNDRLPVSFAQIICLDEVWDNINTLAVSNLSSVSSPHHLAYIIYTSGSSGNPKGVMISHHSLSNLCLSMKPISNDRIGLIFNVSINFDPSVWNIFWPLTSGSSLIIPIGEEAVDAQTYIKLIKKHNIEIFHSGPSLLSTFLQEHEFSSCQTLKQIIGGGEGWPLEIFDKLRATLPDCVLDNTYGPTETTIFVTHKCFLNQQYYYNILPIGRPISNTQIYILDDAMNPVPVGITGEIYIGGIGLARGYLNKADLTAEKFVPNPFFNPKDNIDQEIAVKLEYIWQLRLYRTGDLACYLPDGDVEFLGRIDEQVKIRGFRIELGEIESVLNTQITVNRAVVIAREDEPGRKQLVAYIVPKDSVALALDKTTAFTTTAKETFYVLKGESIAYLTEGLRNELIRSLPEYMIPTFFIYIDQVPMTSNNKIDRKSLPAPDLSTRQVIDEYCTPSTEIEQQLAAVFHELLRIELIGIYDDFFKLGGHSLLATQVVSRIRHIFNIELPLRVIFEHPTISALQIEIEKLMIRNTHSVMPPIVAKKKPDVIPLSFAQARLWFLSELLPDVNLYNIPLAPKLIGPLNKIALEKAFNALISRHESLRTLFLSEHGKAHQFVIPELVIDLNQNLIDLSGKGLEQAALLEQIALQEANTKFDLCRGPLIRIKLVVLSKDEHVLLVTMHHIISDGWSMGIFFNELSQYYNAYEKGIDPKLTPISVQYADFALWQREWLQGEVLEAQLSYWKKQLSNIPESLEIKTDKERPKELSYKGAQYHYLLSKEIGDCLIEISKEQGTSLFMTLLAIFQILLYRYTGQKDIVVGSPIANRHYQEIEGLIGFFVNTLALRTSLEASETFLNVLHQVKETTLQGYQHQDVYFDQLVDYLNVPRVMNRNPVFQVEFSFESSSRNEKIFFDNLTVIPYHVDYTFSKIDLRVLVNESQEGMCLNFDYATDLFEEESIKRFAYHFETLTKEILKDISKPIGSYSILTATEQKQLLLEWNDTQNDYPVADSIVKLFEEQVIKLPNHVAVVFGESQLTYQELNEKANQLAHYLRSLGVRADTLVAIAIHRSLEMVIGMLGILKAGGAYVPLDPEYPEARLQYVLDDTQVPIIITDSRVIDKLPVTFAQIICLDEEWDNINTFAASNLTSNTSSQHLAYVIYTSGSSGNPKGVMISHYSLSNLCLAMKLISNDIQGLIFNVSINFDPSVWIIFWPLTSGSSLIIPVGEETIDPQSYIKLINEHHLEIFHAGPSLLSTLLQENNFNSCQTLKQIIGGGEGWPLEILEKLKIALPDCILDNVYGPTETTIHVTHMTFLNQKYHYNILPIGRPISNTQIYILDGTMNPVPVGIAGEIYIGGVGLARGYLNRTDLTAEKFVPNPFFNTQESMRKQIADSSEYFAQLRLYRTGDLACYCRDGNIEFLGRMDEQVKIRGFRVELGEIESILNTQNSVEQAVVIAREDESSQKSLVAYVVLKESIASSLEKASEIISSAKQTFAILKGERLVVLTEDLRNKLSRSLPDHMIPSFFVYIDQMPLTYNSKIDRKSLPAPDLSERQITDEYIKPSTEIERALVLVWSEVLKIERIGINDDFFKLGGHSLLATQVISRIRHIYNIDIPLRTIFEHPTIKALQQEIRSLTIENTSSVIPPITAKKRPHTIPLSFAQARLWFLSELLPEVTLYNIPLALKLTGSLNKEALEKAFNALISRHESLRTVFPSEEGRAYQFVIPHVVIDLNQNLIDFSGKEQAEQTILLERLATLEFNTNFDLSSGPLIRIKLIILSKEEHVLLVTMHHIISDGWSMGIFFKELSHYYNSYKNGEETDSLPSLPIQYADFALWQREWLQGENLESQLAYWKKELSNIPEVLEIRTDKERPKELSYNGAEFHYSLSRQIKDDLNQLSKVQGSSLFMTLLAIFQILLHRYTGQKDIIVGSPIANRNYQEIEGLIGFFINTLALRTIFEENETFLSVLQKVKETTLQSYQHQDVPFEQLVDHLNITREINRNPVFQVLFMLQNGVVEEASLSLDNICITSILPPAHVAKFDLSVSAYEHNEGLGIDFGYSTDLFEEDTIRRIAIHFEELIKQIIKNTSQSINGLTFLTSQEEAQLLTEWNNTETEFPEDKTVVELFEEQVTKTSSNTAVIFEEKTLNYQDLNEKANQLAHYLRSLGVGADTLVAIAVERSIEMVIGCLGIWKAGGAYVPLDPDYPEARLQYMLEDTKAKFLITESSIEEKLKGALSSYTGTTILIDRLHNQLLQQNTHDPMPITLPHHLAYVIYTSGSTGKPKGVMIPHQNLNNFLLCMKEKLALLPSDKFLAITTLAFDIAGLELYLPLLNGATLFLAKKSHTSNPEDLKRLLDYHDITVMQATPSTWQILLDDSWQGKINLLALCGGEAIQLSLMNRLVGKTKNIWNLYGPTETTIWSSTKFYSNCPGSIGNINKISIGNPLANTQIYILDLYMNLVPIGIAGEVYIGGKGLARGYWNRADLTAEKFVPNPFINGMGLRLYRTGDLARYGVDGNIEFLGRIDEQVKVRGFRIELGEIESALNAQSEVTHAVVVTREDEPGRKHLVAYLVPKENIVSSLDNALVFTSSSGEMFSVLKGEKITVLTENLRIALKCRLPEYMIPSFFVFMDKLPLTTNGKVDRKSLPAPDHSIRQMKDEYSAPSTEIEKKLATIWGEVLRIEKIGIYDNFFKVGGDSIISIQLIAKARQKGIHIAVKDIFNYPTIAGLALVARTGENTFTARPRMDKTLNDSVGLRQITIIDELINEET